MNVEDARERMNEAHRIWQASKSPQNALGNPAAIRAYSEARSAFEAAKIAPPDRRPDRILSMGSLTSRIQHFDESPAPVTSAPPTIDPLEL